MPVMTARFAIKGVRKSYSHALFHACGGCSAPRCLYKVTKISRQLQTARKNLGENPMLYAGFGEPITGDEKKFRLGNVKNSALFSGNPGKNGAKRGHSRTYLDKMELAIKFTMKLFEKFFVSLYRD